MVSNVLRCNKYCCYNSSHLNTSLLLLVGSLEAQRLHLPIAMLEASRSRPAATKFEILFRKKQWRYVIVQEERDKSEEHFE